LKDLFPTLRNAQPFKVKTPCKPKGVPAQFPQKYKEISELEIRMKMGKE